MKPTIKWLRHSSILIEDEKNIVVDPWKINCKLQADLVLITHSHFDHLSPDDIQKILPKGGTIIAPADCLESLEEYNCLSILPNESKNLNWVEITAIPAYTPNKEFHPRNNNWVGYKIQFKTHSVYISGDSDITPEMKSVKADTVILPVGGTYTMNAKEAAEVVNTISPLRAIPIHYGDITGKAGDGDEFKSYVTTAKVEILKPICI